MYFNAIDVPVNMVLLNPPILIFLIFITFTIFTYSVHRLFKNVLVHFQIFSEFPLGNIISNTK